MQRRHAGGGSTHGVAKVVSLTALRLVPPVVCLMAPSSRAKRGSGVQEAGGGTSNGEARLERSRGMGIAATTQSSWWIVPGPGSPFPCAVSQPTTAGTTQRLGTYFVILAAFLHGGGMSYDRWYIYVHTHILLCTPCPDMDIHGLDPFHLCTHKYKLAMAIFLLIFDYVSAIDARHDWQNPSSTGLAVAHLDPPSSKSARPRPLLNMPKCACEQPTLVDCATTRCDAPCNLSIGLVRSPASSVALPWLWDPNPIPGNPRSRRSRGY